MWICYCCMGRCRCEACKSNMRLRVSQTVSSLSLSQKQIFCLPALPHVVKAVKRSNVTESLPSSLSQQSQSKQLVQQPKPAVLSQPQEPSNSSQSQPVLDQSVKVQPPQQQQQQQQQSVQLQQLQPPQQTTSKIESDTDSNKSNRIQRIPKTPSCDLSVYSNRRVLSDVLVRFYVPLCYLHFC